MTAPVEDDPRLGPLTAVSAWFAARHAKDQEDVAANLTLGLFPLWQIMRFQELDASTTLWLASVMPRVETAFLQSQRLAGVFNANVRAAELATDPPLLIDVPDVQFSLFADASSFRMPPLVEGDPPLPQVEVEQQRAIPAPPTTPAQPDAPGLPQDVLDQLERGRQLGTPQWVLDRIEAMAGGQKRVELQEFPRADVAQSLTIEANYNTKRAMPGPEEELMHNALVRSSGAAVRQAMNGGRGVTDRIMAADKKVRGFARVTDSDPCAFCALLASRGAVYGKGSFIRSDAAREAERGKKKSSWALNPEAARDVPDGWTNVAKVHNNCRCQLRPVYATESAWDAGAKHFLAVWNKRGDYVNTEDTLDIIDRHPDWKGWEVQRAVDLRAFKRALEDRPFKGNQFDIAQMRNDLRSRRDGLLDNGFSAGSPQVQWAEQTLDLVA